MTAAYDLQRPGRFIEGNSLAAPQLALVASLVRENARLSVQDALRIVRNTTDLIWHRFAKRYVHLINEPRARLQARRLDQWLAEWAR